MVFNPIAVLWPNYHVVSANSTNEKFDSKVAKLLYIFLFFGYVAAIIVTIILTLRSEDVTNTTFAKESIRFPLVTLCSVNVTDMWGIKWTEGKAVHDCSYQSSISGEFEGKTCTSKEVPSIGPAYEVTGTGPCVVYNTDASFIATDGDDPYLSIRLFVNDTDRECFDNLFESRCPKLYHLVFSDKDPSVNANGNYSTNFMHSFGLVTLKAEVQRFIDIKGSESLSYKMSHQVHASWDGMLVIRLYMSDIVMTMKTVKGYSISVLWGCVGGYFTYVTLIFSLFFVGIDRDTLKACYRHRESVEELSLVEVNRRLSGLMPAIQQNKTGAKNTSLGPL